MGYVQVYHNDPDTAIYLANLEMDRWAEEVRQAEQAELARLEESQMHNDPDIGLLCFGTQLGVQMKEVTAENAPAKVKRGVECFGFGT